MLAFRVITYVQPHALDRSLQDTCTHVTAGWAIANWNTSASKRSLFTGCLFYYIYYTLLLGGAMREIGESPCAWCRPGGLRPPALSEHLRPPIVLSPPTSGLRLHNASTQRARGAPQFRIAYMQSASKPAVAHHDLHGTRHLWCSVGDERSKVAWAVGES